MFYITAVFTDGTGAEKYTEYREVLFATNEIAEEWLNGSYGEQLSQASDIDTQIDPELKDFWFDDLVVEEE